MLDDGGLGARRLVRRQIECGLLDWANVSQMNVAIPIWGCLSDAELGIWDDHLDELLALFVQEFESCTSFAASSSVLPQLPGPTPKVIVPRHSGDTRTPEQPSGR